MIMPHSAVTPRIATKPSGAWKIEQRGDDADESERRREEHHEHAREALELQHQDRQDRDQHHREHRRQRRLALSLSSTAPPTSMR